MKSNEQSTLRSLSDSELYQVAGGDCTCGVGANCTTSSTISTPLGTVLVMSNCSGLLVHYELQN